MRGFECELRFEFEPGCECEFECAGCGCPPDVWYIGDACSGRESGGRRGDDWRLFATLELREAGPASKNRVAYGGALVGGGSGRSR